MCGLNIALNFDNKSIILFDGRLEYKKFMKNKVKALFLIQMFDTKKLNDSAGLNEIAKPMVQSNCLSEHRVFSWGLGEDYIKKHIASECISLKKELGSKPVTIYGAGAHTEGAWKNFSQLNVVSIADKQPEKIGTSCCNKIIISPDKILTDIIVISSRAWEEDILKEMQAKYPDKKIFPLYLKLQDEMVVENGRQLRKLEEEVSLADFDLIFYTPAEPAEALSKEQLMYLKMKSNARLLSVWWDYDDSSLDNVYMSFEKLCLDSVDMIIDPGNYGKTQRMQRGDPPYHLHENTNKVVLLPTPVDNSLFYPREKTIDIALFGSDVGLRRKWVDLLMATYPRQFRHIGGVGGFNVAIPMADYSRMAGESKIIVNSQTYSFRSQCKGKVREALASGSLLLEEDCYESRCFFGNEVFVKFYKTEKELLALIDYYLEHEDERERLSRMGHKWYIENWSSAVWTNKVFNHLAKISPSHLIDKVTHYE